MFASSVVTDQARVKCKTDMRSFSCAHENTLRSLEDSLRERSLGSLPLLSLQESHTAYDDFPMHQCAGGNTAACWQAEVCRTQQYRSRLHSEGRGLVKNSTCVQAVRRAAWEAYK